MRVFFAIEFEDLMKEQLFKIQQIVRKECTAGNFTQKNNFHLTLRFIGEQTPAQVEKLRAVLQETAAGGSPFQLHLGSFGAFTRGSKKILWMGVNKSSNLDLLQQKLEEILAENGYEREERPFRPHITLGREVRMVPGDSFMDDTCLKLENPLIRVTRISLMESKRIDNVLCYVPLLKAELI